MRSAISSSFAGRTLAIAIAAFAALFSWLSVLRHDAFNTGRFDMGNMVQAVWSTAHGDFLQVTSGSGEQISRLAAHTDLILVLFAPLWWLWPSVSMLVTVQAAALALGALPVYWLARKHLRSERAGAAFALAYLLYPATGWLALNEFHPVALACPLLLFAFWYLDEERLLPFAVFAAAAILSKEEIGLVVAGMGIWYALARGRRRAGGAIFLAGVAASAIAVEAVVPHFNRGGPSSFYSRYRGVGGSPDGIVKTLFTHPLRVLETAFDEHGGRYLGGLLVPLAGLCLLAPLVLIAALPELALNLLSDVPFQSSIHFHYTAGLIPPLVAASVLGAAWIARSRPAAAPWLPLAAVAAALGSNYVLGAIPFWGYFPGGVQHQRYATRVTEHDRIAGDALRRIPSDAVVSATNWLGGHLSARRRILSFPKLADATWVAVDETRPTYLDSNALLPAESDVVALRRNPGWRLVFERDGVLIFRRV